MEIVSAKDFRANQMNILTKALRGESIFLSSRIGMFKISPVTEKDTLTNRICEGLKEIQLMESGKLPAKSARTFLNEL